MSGNITLKGNLLFRDSGDIDSGKIDLDSNKFVFGNVFKNL